MKGGQGITKKNERKNSFADIQELLPKHVGYFAPYVQNSHYGDEPEDFSFGIATFIKSDIKSSFHKSIKLLDPTKKWSDYSGRFAGGAALSVDIEGFTIINVHGLWQDLEIEDTEAKIEESHRLISLANETKGRKVLCGDFNLVSGTRPIKILENSYINLIDKNHITDTRGPLYAKPNRFSDYIFVDHDLRTKSIEVPNVSISDHLPLIMEFS